MEPDEGGEPCVSCHEIISKSRWKQASVKLRRGCHTNDVWQPHCSFDILLQKTTLTNLVSKRNSDDLCKEKRIFTSAILCR